MSDSDVSITVTISHDFVISGWSDYHEVVGCYAKKQVERATERQFEQMTLSSSQSPSHSLRPYGLTESRVRRGHAQPAVLHRVDLRLVVPCGKYNAFCFKQMAQTGGKSVEPFGSRRLSAATFLSTSRWGKPRQDSSANIGAFRTWI